MTVVFSGHELLETTVNPAPAGAELLRVTTADGVSLRAAAWSPASRPRRGTVLLLQGRAEFIEKYFEVASELLGRGFRVVTFDWRGQGGSDRGLPDRHRGHVRHFSEFRHDYEAVAGRVLAQVEREDLTVLAHSMGGCIALTAASEGWLGAARLVCSSPMIGLSLVKRPGPARAAARWLTRLGLAGRLVPGGQSASISTLAFPGNRLCTDERRYARNAAVATALGWGAIGSPTFGWLAAAYEAMDQLGRANAPRTIRVPTLVVAAGDDPVCSTPAIERFARRLLNGTLLTIPGARHEIMMETDAMRAMFWEAFDAFTAASAGTPDR